MVLVRGYRSDRENMTLFVNTTYTYIYIYRVLVIRMCNAHVVCILYVLYDDVRCDDDVVVWHVFPAAGVLVLVLLLVVVVLMLMMPMPFTVRMH